jgi:hypothetical protein
MGDIEPLIKSKWSLDPSNEKCEKNSSRVRDQKGWRGRSWFQSAWLFYSQITSEREVFIQTRIDAIVKINLSFVFLTSSLWSFIDREVCWDLNLPTKTKTNYPPHCNQYHLFLSDFQFYYHHALSNPKI